MEAEKNASENKNKSKGEALENYASKLGDKEPDDILEEVSGEECQEVSEDGPDEVSEEEGVGQDSTAEGKVVRKDGPSKENNKNCQIAPSCDSKLSFQWDSMHCIS